MLFHTACHGWTSRISSVQWPRMSVYCHWDIVGLDCWSGQWCCPVLLPRVAGEECQVRTSRLYTTQRSCVLSSSQGPSSAAGTLGLTGSLEAVITQPSLSASIHHGSLAHGRHLILKACLSSRQVERARSPGLQGGSPSATRGAFPNCRSRPLGPLYPGVQGTPTPGAWPCPSPRAFPLL